jgi:transcriptional regulator of NAD metabolism
MSTEPKWKSLPTKDELAKVKSHDELRKLVDLKTLIQALNYLRTNKKSHYIYNLTQKLMVQKAKDAGLTVDVEVD